MDIRRAIVWASAGQYFTLIVNFAVTLLLARVLTPFEFGVSAIGIAVIGIAEAMREIAGGTFLVRERDLTPGKIRTTTTLNLLLTVLIGAATVLLAEPLSGFFGVPGLASYLLIAVAGFAAGWLLYPQQALLSRDMAFDRLAAVNVASTVGGSIASITLALSGFGANSFAIGAVVTSIIGVGMVLTLGRGIAIYRPSLSEWRSVMGFGIHSSATAIAGRLAEALPLFIFGRLLGPADLAIGHRALLLCLVPERLITAVTGAVALPELSRLSREGGDLKRAYLTALANVTVLHLPVMAMLALLALPVVEVLLGQQWLHAAPLVTILSLALMATAPIMLQYPVLVAAGGVHLLPRLVVLQTGVTAMALAASAGYGLHAAAASMLIALPLNAIMSLLAVHMRLRLSPVELAGVVLRSGVVTLATVAVPIMFIFYHPGSMPPGMAVVLGMAAAPGWMIGLYASGHPLWSEIVRIAASLTNARIAGS